MKASQKVGELGYDALFINDGDAEPHWPLGDSRGNYVNAHRITRCLPSTWSTAARRAAWCPR